MPQPADETRLGELLVTTGKLSSEELLACLEAQRLQGGPQRKRLGEIMVDCGHITAPELQEAVAQALAPKGHAVQGPSTAHAEPLSHEVRQAQADPTRRVGRYVLLSKLGQGGMGVVYRGYDPMLRREVAIKTITGDRSADQGGRTRFMREAQACAKLRHPAIVAIHEAGEHDGQPYLVMDLVEGQTLAEVLDGDSLSLRDLASVTRDIAMALDHAHTAGIIHRDVKPGNIMLSKQGQPLLMDFGLARETSAQQQLTKTGEVLGTPLYMAPEQIKGSNLGPWTDVYGLGAVLYRGLTGSPPFTSDNTISLFRAILMDEPQSPRALNADVTPDLETITLKCLEKEPHRRYPSTAALADELGRFLDGQAILARPIGRSEKAARWMQRNRALTAALAMVVLLALMMVGATVVVVAQVNKAEQEKRQLSKEAERGAVHREKRATILAEQEATRKEKERAHEESLELLRREVAEVLDQVRAGEALADLSDFRIKQLELLKHREPEAVNLITAELDELSDQLAKSHSMSKEKELFLRFLCETLADIHLQESSVAALGHYLKTELALPIGKINQLRAVPAGKALCLLGGEEADRLLLESRDGFGPNGAFWGQVSPFYERTGIEPGLEDETASGYLNRGLARQAKGDLDGAIADHSRAIEIEPNDAAAWINRGAVRQDKGDLDGAVTDFTRAIEIDPNYAIAWNNRGYARRDNGDLDGAIADLTHAIEIDPNYALAWINRGTIRKAKGDLDGAIADYTRAIEIDPNYAIAWNNRGNARTAEGDLDGAIADFNSAIDIDPNLAMAWRNRGLARQAKGDLDGAIADHTRAIEINPNYVMAWNDRGITRKTKGDLDGAIADYTRAIEIDPKYDSAWDNRGNARRAKGDLDGAIADHTRAIEIDPSHATAWANRGITRKAKGNLDGAIADHTRAIEINPNYVMAWNDRGIARKAKGDLDGAIADWTRAIKIDVNYVMAWNNRGVARKAKGDLDGAIADYDRAIEIDPNYALAWSNRGNARTAAGDLDGAIADFNRAIDIDPNLAMVWSNRGLARKAKGDLDGAIADYSRALELDPNNAMAWYYRGVARRPKGDLDGAIADWQRFLELAPDHPQAPDVRADLQKARALRAKAAAGSGK